MASKFLYTLPIYVFSNRVGKDLNEVVIFDSAPDDWEEINSKYPGIELKWINHKGEEQIVNSQESYETALMYSNGQCHYFDTDYEIRTLIIMDNDSEPLPSYFLYCLRCEFNNHLFFIKCANCGNNNKKQLVYKQGIIDPLDQW